MNPPAGAVYAKIDLLYQGTSWEYVQFLERANTQQNAFLGQEGINMMEAWLNTGITAPYVMTSAIWGTPPAGVEIGVSNVTTGYYQVTGKGNNQAITFVATSDIPVGEVVIIRSVVTDGNGDPVSGAIVRSAISDPANATVISGSSDENGIAEAEWQTSAPKKNGTGGTATGSYTVTTSDFTGN